MLSAAEDAFIRDQRVGRLATVDEAGAPHVVPVCFAFADGIVYSVIDAKPKRVGAARLRRLRNIRSNPAVQLLVDHYDEDWRSLAYVQLRGRATILEAGDEQSQAIGLLRVKYRQYAAMDIDSSPVVRIAVERAVSWGLDTVLS